MTWQKKVRLNTTPGGGPNEAAVRVDDGGIYVDVDHPFGGYCGPLTAEMTSNLIEALQDAMRHLQEEE